MCDKTSRWRLVSSHISARPLSALNYLLPAIWCSTTGMHLSQQHRQTFGTRPQLAV